MKLRERGVREEKREPRRPWLNRSDQAIAQGFAEMRLVRSCTSSLIIIASWIDRKLRGFRVCRGLPSFCVPLTEGSLPADATVNTLADWSSEAWDQHVINASFSPEVAQAIFQVPIGWASSNDWWTWLYEKKGEFTVSSAYIVAFKFRFQGDEGVNNSPSSWRQLWKLDISPKIKMFLWRVFNDCLPTLSYL
ncbi:hypothetical protein Droror1_Dr00005759 [Drosera rotundifolia]